MPELAAAAAAAPPRWNSDLKTPSKIYEFAGIPKNLNWVISSRFWIIPKKKKNIGNMSWMGAAGKESH
nr:hypothetical protein CFP56_08530 [Quercus suber]